MGSDSERSAEVLHSTVQYSMVVIISLTTLHYTTLHYTRSPHNTIQYNTIQYNTIQSEYYSIVSSYDPLNTLNMLSSSPLLTFLLPLFLWTFTHATSNFEQYPPFSLPEVQYSELLALDEFTVNQLVKQLTTIGAVQVVNIPKFGIARKEALEDAAECLKTEKTSQRWVMTDGSIRYSTAAETVDGVRGPMRNHCGDASYRLRSLIDAVGRQLFVALDSKLQKGGSLKGADLLMKPAYRSFSQLTARGSHLEHLHSYFPPEVSADSTTSLSQNNIAAMDFHTDAGLMIAMTTGYFSSEQPSVRSGLYLAVPGADGKEKRVKAVMAEDSLILLMGEGARNWLKPVFEKPFRAVPHAMVVDIPPGSSNSRAWFGKMYLPPTDAILPSENIPYSQYHQYESDYQSNKHHLPLACGGSPSYQIILQNQPCEVNGEPGVYCWTQVSVSCAFFATFCLIPIFSANQCRIYLVVKKLSVFMIAPEKSLKMGRPLTAWGIAALPVIYSVLRSLQTPPRLPRITVMDLALPCQ